VSPLLIRTFPTPVATVVNIAGEIDIAAVTELRGQLDALPDRNTVVDMSEVTLLSATGMSVLLEWQDRLTSVGARLVLAAGSHHVRRVLAVTGLDAQLRVVATVADAIDAAEAAEAAEAAGQPESIRAVISLAACRAATRRYPSLGNSGTGLRRGERTAGHERSARSRGSGDGQSGAV
jgi:anti-sigma B factor antagonist